MNEENHEKEIGKDEEGVSIRDIFRIIGKKIWYVLAGTLLVTIAAVLVFALAINPAKKYESMSFQINSPMNGDGKYPDGSTFNYRDMISTGVVKGAIAKDESFASLDADKIDKNEAISVSASRDSDDERYVYTISLKARYFSGVDTEDFVEQLTEAFKDYIMEKAQSLDFTIDGTIFEETSYKNQLELLKKKEEALEKEYGEWIKKYGEGRTVNGVSLGDYLNDLMTVFDDNAYDLLDNELTISGYEYFNKNVDADAIQKRVEVLKAEKSLLEKKLEKLNGTGAASGASFMSYAAQKTGEEESGTIINMPTDPNLTTSQMKASIIERLAVVEKQLEVLEDSATTPEEIAKYGNENLAPYLTALNARADTLKGVISAICRSDTVVTFDSRRATSEGGTSLVIVGIAVFVVAFLSFAIIAFFVGRKSFKPKKSESAPEKENEKTE